MGNFLMNKRVFVTGASGFIGSHLCKKLVELGAVVGVTRHLEEVSAPFDEIYSCNLNYLNEVQEAVKDFSPDYVVHLASQAIVQEGKSHPLRTIKTNVIGTTNLLEAVLDEKRYIKVVVASTDKVYGRHLNLPYEENYALLGTKQIYEASKNCEDVISQAYAYSYGMNILITRCGNVYGPGDLHFSRLIPGVIRSYCENENPIIRSNGQQYRDYVYIDDVVSAYVKLLEQDTGISPDIFNFGNGFGSRVMDVVAMIAEQFPNAPIPDIRFGAKDEIGRQYLDATKAKEVLGWKPETKLKDGVIKTVGWYKEFFNGKSN